MQTIQKNIWEKQNFSTQPQDVLEIQVIHPQAQTRNVKLEVMHLKPDHLCMQEQLNQCSNFQKLDPRVYISQSYHLSLHV